MIAAGGQARTRGSHGAPGGIGHAPVGFPRRIRGSAPAIRTMVRSRSAPPQEASAVKRPRSAATLAGLAATALLAGCASLTSPATIIKPYDAADGTTVRPGGSSLTLADFLVVGAAQGQPAEVSGSVINVAASPVKVTLSAGSGSDQTEVTVGGNSVVKIGPDQVYSLSLSSLPVVPGARIQMSASTPAAGSTAFSVPVLRPVGYYADLTPSPTPAPTTSARKAPSSAATTATPTPTPTS